MPEVRLVEYDTKFKATAGTNVLVITMQRSIEVANTIDSDVNLTTHDKFINNKKIIPGELVMTMKNKLRDIDAFIEGDSGDLIVSAEDAKNYTLNNQGHLIYTYR